MANADLQTDTHNQALALIAAGGALPAFRIPKWFWFIAAAGALVGVYVLVSAAIQVQAEGAKRRSSLLAWAAGSDAQALMGLSGAWQATFPGRQPPRAGLDGVAAVSEIQRRNEVFFQGGSETDRNQLQPLLGSAFQCLSDDAAACIAVVGQREGELDSRARAPATAKRAAMPVVPWSDSRSAVPTLLASAQQFLTFERMKARGGSGVQMNDDHALSAILALCLRQTVRDAQGTPKRCADWVRARLAERQAPDSVYPVTRERLAMLNGWRWTAAGWAYNAAAKTK